MVESFSNDYIYDLGEIIGSYRALAPSGLQGFLEAAEEHDYHVAFFEDPTQTLNDFEHLNRVPEVTIESTFDNTVNGMLPFQVQGYNMLKDEPWGVARWDTGTGKTVFAASMIKYHQLQGDHDLTFVVVKKHNKVNTVRKLKRLGDVDALYVRGTKARREKTYRQIADELERGNPVVVVLNYEQFKFDFTTRDKQKRLILTDWGERFFPNRRLMCIWDEMPTKLKTRTSDLYKSICKCLYRTDPPQTRLDRLRPASLRSYMLSATPIENSPEDWFNCLRLMDGGSTYGTVSAFNEVYVESWNFFDNDKPETFHNLERMRLTSAYMVHQATKKDPDIAQYFPKVIEEPVYIDWDEKNRKLYQTIEQAVRDNPEAPLFALIGVLQMFCDMPTMILDSAARRELYEEVLDSWDGEGKEPSPKGSQIALMLMEQFAEQFTNQNHPKLEELREILLERHPTSQVAIYTKWNQTLMPYLEAFLKEWGVSYVRYHGTDRQKQRAQDAFQNGEVRVFLSSDSGSDSIDLDAGNVVIDYNLPWTWTKIVQRHNRVHRPTSNHDTVYYYSLILVDSVEERTQQIISRKQGYHNELFDPAAGDFSASARLTKEELLWILTGGS